MKVAVLAFIAVVGTYAEKFAYNGESWKQEFDIVDFAQMNLKQVFSDWSVAFERNYASPVEEYKRFGVWLNGMRTIAQWNSNSEKTSKLRPNQFTDMTAEEFKLYIHGNSESCLNRDNKHLLLSNLERKFHESGKKDKAAPSSVDWEAQGKVTAVKNQGQCGSCWAFSTTGSLECQGAIKNGNLYSLSEQELVDCSGSYGNMGCNGGLMDNAFKYVEAEGGLCSESEYPYKGRDGSCNKNCGTRYDAISGYTDVKSDSESSLEAAVAEGCVSVAIEADQTAFQYYSSGVLTGKCGTRLDHGVLVVGYGTDGSQDYWKVKNSWGTSWGMDGYVLICRDCNKNGNAGECGIDSEPSYPQMK